MNGAIDTPVGTGAGTVAVIGGGPAGLRAALAVTEAGARAILIEQRTALGGMPIAAGYAGLTPRGEQAEPLLLGLAAEVTASAAIDVRLGAEVTAVAGEPGAFTLSLGPAGQVECEAVIVATGFQHFDPGRATQLYGYYEYPDVVTIADLEPMLRTRAVRRPSDGATPQRICFIQCVGSRDRQVGNEYCSKVCCGVASKQAIELREQLPESEVFVFYIDMRTYGYWENELYWPAQETHHVQYVKGMITEVLAKGSQLLVRGEDTTMGRPMEMPVDLVVLSVGMEPSAGTRTVAGLLGVRQNKYGFIDTAGGVLDPVRTDREAVYACGAALGPADLEDCATSAAAAAVRAVGYLRSRAVPASS
ncbi:MAG: FAD-dependent oxidoreductase [Streptosporangiaceae bacterium]